MLQLTYIIISFMLNNFHVKYIFVIGDIVAFRKDCNLRLTYLKTASDILSKTG